MKVDQFTPSGIVAPITVDQPFSSQGLSAPKHWLKKSSDQHTVSEKQNAQMTVIYIGVAHNIRRNKESKGRLCDF